MGCKIENKIKIGKSSNYYQILDPSDKSIIARNAFWRLLGVTKSFPCLEEHIQIQLQMVAAHTNIIH